MVATCVARFGLEDLMPPPYISYQTAVRCEDLLSTSRVYVSVECIAIYIAVSWRGVYVTKCRVGK